MTTAKTSNSLQDRNTFSSGGYNHVQLAGLRSSGRHGDGCGVVAFPMFGRRRLEVGGDDFAPTGVADYTEPGKLLARGQSNPKHICVVVGLSVWSDLHPVGPCPHQVTSCLHRGQASVRDPPTGKDRQWRPLGYEHQHPHKCQGRVCRALKDQFG